MPMKLSAPPSADVLLAAYEKHAEEIRELPDDRLLARVNFDFTAAVAVVLGAHPALLAHRDVIREHLPKVPLRYVDHLDSIAHAALYVYMQSRAAPAPESGVAALAETARLARRKLQADAASAIAHELLDEGTLDGIPTGNGRLEIAQGLLGLCVAFRAAWPKVRGRSAVTEESLAASTQLGVELLAALGRDDNPAASGGAQAGASRWLRAASFFYHAYDQCRRAMTYVRWDEGDAADFTPALVGARGPRAKAASTGDPAGNDEPKPVTPSDDDRDG